MAQFSYINVKKVALEGVTIHTVQAPEDGEMTNAQVIETSERLILVDTLQLKTHSDELKTYIDGLGKPLDRVIVTHFHPDHWMGAPSFKDYPIYALGEVIGSLQAMADYFIGYHRSLHPDNADTVIHAEKVLPTELLAEGILEIDGIKLNMIKVVNTESPVNLVIELPEQGALLAQDLIYHKVFGYFGDRTSDGQYCFDNWIAALEGFKTKGYDHVFPGHGDPADGEVLDEQIDYLKFVRKLVYDGEQGEELIGKIIAEYPDYRLYLTLHMSNYMLFIFQMQ